MPVARSSFGPPPLFRPGSGKRRPVRRTAVLALALWAATTTAVSAAPPASAQVDPADVEVVLGPGQSAQVAKKVTTPAVPPKPDLVLLADTTGSMGAAIASVRANADAVTGQVLSAQPAAQFAVAEYRDTGDAFAFRVDQALTADRDAVRAGIGRWSASGGGDTPESAINALHQIGQGATGFRPDSTRIVAWFGDAPSHDPVLGRSLSDAIGALRSAGVRVVAVNVAGAGSGLDAGGQASRITRETGGVLLNQVPPDQVARAILDGVREVPVTVTPRTTSCDARLSVRNEPSSRTVTSGAKAEFAETVEVKPGTPAGTYHCTVDYQVDGRSLGFVERTKVHVPGVRVGDATASEGDGQAVFTVSLDRPSPKPVTLRASTSDGSAVAPGDYAATSQVLTFAPGETTKAVAVPLVSDTVDELDETLALRLGEVAGAAVSDGEGVGTILDDDRDGVFTCRASVANVAGIEPVVANPPNSPCAEADQTTLQANLGSGLLNARLNALSARTDQTPDDPSASRAAEGDSVVSRALVETTTLSALGVSVELGVIRSEASVTCVAGGHGLEPRFSGGSTIDSLKVNGVPVTVVGSQPVTIPLVVGSLRLNSTERTADGLVQRAVVLDALLVKVVVGEARVGYRGTDAHPGGNPCQG
ncbi:hyalin [Actinosynnema pretiosum subsp. pretiosum]|uniref:Hyalin n=1 Tax=Actinosynnema pretiosum subsp. pretiosum TaxID=103721 RepID=A0AA45L742_9PSEU|nr:protein of unknown function (DUF1555) [Actinosynnema pretiosum subsp. pretiosum]QUF04551.1 hyalin [Actinosynnema pretiosum subsp. pretiosum]